MEKILKLYTYVNGVNDTPFPNQEDQVIIGDFRCDYKRMGSAPTISCSVMHPLCLDNLWSYNVYASFNGERFFIKQIPTSSFDNTDSRYKHELELVSERVILDNVYFYDVVSEDYEDDKPVSNSSNFVFFGDIHEFAQRLNHSLNYSKLNYSVVVDEGISSESKLLSFQDQFFSNVLQEIYNVYEIPYYVVGNEIHIGYAEKTIDNVFKYGCEESLLSIQKQNANRKVVNRITGVGSSDNVPYYYPNFDNKGVTEVLYNGESGKVNIIDKYKYNKLKLNDNLSYNIKKNDDKSLLDGHFFTDIDYTFTDVEEQYAIEFYYKFTIKEVSDIRFSLITTTPTDTYPTTNDIHCDLYNENDVNIGTFNDNGVKYDLPKGSYKIKVVWNVYTPITMTRPYAEELVIEYTSVNATIVGKTEAWWSLNGKMVNLSDYGISLNVSPIDGAKITFNQISYIKTSQNLMPSIYRESLAKERFYNAENDEYINPETDEYYTFHNPFIIGKPKEHIENFEDIKPTIKGITNADGMRIDMFSEFAFDENDNDEFDEEGNYLHPYFFGKLRKFDGEHGFNLFDHSIDEDEMVIAMTSGSCGGCEFIIGVDEDTQKNIVQVDEQGNLLRDSNGNVIRSGQALESQNDTRTNEVWIALKKDQNTFGVLMPNASNKYRPQIGDTFVILHIDLPQSYILSAEKRLEQELIKYMHENNDEKFTFSLSFSRIFFAENPDILEQLNENSRIKIEYDGRQYQLYVSSYTCNISKEQPLPEIRIELSDVVSSAQNSLSNTISTLKNDVLSNISLTESQIMAYTSTVKKDLNSKVDNTKQEIDKTISNVETAMQEYTNDARAVLQESLKAINEIKVNTDNVYTKDDINKNFVTVATEQEVSGSKNFTGGLKVNSKEIKYNSINECWILLGNLAVTGGITMYADDGSVNIPTIAEGLPFDGKTIWYNPTTKVIEVIGGTGGGTADAVAWDNITGKPTWIGTTKPSYTYSEIDGTPDLSVYATQSWVEGKGYALSSDLTALSIKLNDFLEGNDTDTIINKWLELETFLSGLSESDNLATILSGKANSSDLANYIPIKDYTEVLGEKNFTGGLKVNGSPIVYDATNKYWKLEGDLLVTGGVTMYANEGTYTPSTIMDALSVDNTNLKVVDGVLTFVGSTGGATTLGALSNVGSWADSVASQDRIMYQAANSSQWVAKNLSDLAVGGVTGDYLPLTGGELSGSLAVTAMQNGYWSGGIRIDGTTEKPPSLAFHIANLAGWRLYMDKNQKLLWENSSNDQGVTSREILHSSNYSYYALPLSGGTITNTAYAPLTLHQDYGVYGVSIKFTNADDGLLGYLGIRGSGNTDYPLQPIFENSSGVYKIWHSGNDGSGSGLDADLLDGIHSYDFFRKVAWNPNINNYGDGSNANGIIYINTSDKASINAPFNYGSILSMNYDAGSWMLACGSDGWLGFRDRWWSGNGTTWRDWRTIAFTTSNVASATKLQTARTIWGQSFDGTGNVDGTLSINGVELLYGNTSNIYVGNGDILTYLSGSSLQFRIGSASHMILNSSGNVGIGTTSPSYKLETIGLIASTTKTGGADVGLDANGTSYRLFFGVGSGDVNRGIYDRNNASWWIYRDGTTNTLIPQGAIGLGTTSPKGQLHIIQSAWDNGIVIDRSVTGGGSAISVYSNGTYIGNFGINGAQKFEVNKISSGTASVMMSVDSSGNGLFVGGITMYSDQRKKTILNHVELSLKEIAEAPLIEHYYNSDEKKTTHVGSIAQYWAGLNDWFCKVDNEGYYTMEIQNAALASAISVARELVKFETETDRRIRLLEEENKRLKEEVEQLKWNIA